MKRPLIKPGTWNIPEHRGTFCNISEHRIIMIIMRKILTTWQGNSERSDWFFLGQDFTIRTVSTETAMGCEFFVFESRQIQSKHGPSAI